MRTEQVTLRIPTEILAEARAVAEAEHLKLAQVLVRWLRDKSGIDWKVDGVLDMPKIPEWAGVFLDHLRKIEQQTLGVEDLSAISQKRNPVDLAREEAGAPSGTEGNLGGEGNDESPQVEEVAGQAQGLRLGTSGGKESGERSEREAGALKNLAGQKNRERAEATGEPHLTETENRGDRTLSGVEIVEDAGLHGFDPDTAVPPHVYPNYGGIARTNFPKKVSSAADVAGALPKDQSHNPRTCRIYKCGMCATLRGK